MNHPDLSTLNPGLYKHMVQFDAQATKACQDSGLSDLLIELVRLRVSQINGCAFCLRMHTRDALAKGETSDRLGVLAAWWESQYFTDQEEAALTLAEDATRLPVPQRDLDGRLTDQQISAVTWLVIVMNAWNRIAIQSHYPVDPKD